jgi:hypothetical protein
MTNKTKLPEVTLIIHGWSSYSLAFKELKNYLIAQGLGDVNTIVYADYESREDNLTFNDIVHGLNDRMRENGFIDQNGKKLCNMNVIVHSTGGLVIRNWIWRYYHKDGDRIKDCPVKNILMLAPANFGSPLAHRGKSLLGALSRGRRDANNFLEVGRQILDGLELGSAYQWDLANKDLILNQPYYNSAQIKVSVLVGIERYDGLQSLINKPGTDGTVVIAGTNLNSAKLTLDFCKPGDKCPYNPYRWVVTKPIEDYGFGVLQSLNHDTIVRDITTIGPYVVAALKCKTKKQFNNWQKQLNKTTEQTYNATKAPKFQQFIVHAIDEQDVPVTDFTLEFFIVGSKRKQQHTLKNNMSYADEITDLELLYSRTVQDIISSEFHTYSKDPSYRRFLVNRVQVLALMDKFKNETGEAGVLSMRIHVPDIDRGIRYDTTNLKNLILYDPTVQAKESLQFFYDNTTTLLELRVERCNDYVSIGPDPKKH